MSGLRASRDRRRDQLEAVVAALQEEYDSAPAAVFALDWEGRRAWSNPAYDELIGDPGEPGADGETHLPPQRRPASGAASASAPGAASSATPRAADGTAPGAASETAPEKLGLDYRSWMADRLGRVLGAEVLEHGVEAIRMIVRHPVDGPLEVLFTGRELHTTDGERLGWIGFAAGLDPPDLRSEARVPDVHSCLIELHHALDACRGRLQGLVSGRGDGRDPGGHGARALPLTGREREILDELLRGYRVPAIARRLSISPYTVRNHLKSVFKKVGVQSQGELVEILRRGS